jgi:hypothetical protein
MIRNHVRWSQKLASRLAATSDFRVTTGAVLSLFSFRHEPKNIADLDNYNLRLINAINDDGRIYLTQERVDGQFVIRFQAGSFEITEADAYEAFDVIVEIAQRLSAEAGVPDHKPNVRDKAKRPGSRPSQPATRPDARRNKFVLAPGCDRAHRLWTYLASSNPSRSADVGMHDQPLDFIAGFHSTDRLIGGRSLDDAQTCPLHGLRYSCEQL